MSESGGVDGERELPAGWAWATLQEVAHWGSGGTPNTKEPAYYGGEIPWAVIGDLKDSELCRTGQTITEDGLANSSARWVPAGSVLVAMYGASIGKLAVTTKPVTTNQAIAHAVPYSGVMSRKYLFWYLYGQRDALIGAGKGGAQPNISQAVLKSWPIAVPPIAEQHRIVETLEEQLSRLDVAELAVLRVLRRQARLVGAVRDRLVHAEGDLPEGWSWRFLGDVVERVEAGKSFRCEPRPATDDEWGVIKVSAMTWGEFRQEEQKAVPFGREVDTRHEIRAGDILVSRANTPEYVGAPVLVRKTRPRLLLSDKSLRLVPVPGVCRDWLISVLSAPLVRQQITAKATGSKDSMRNISQKDLLSVRVPVPPEKEQPRLAEHADEMLSGIEGVEREAKRALERVTVLRQAVLRQAFSGQLVRQESGEEPASTLLARIATKRAAQPRRMRTPTAKAKAPAPRAAEAAAPEPTPAPALAVQQEFDL